MLCQLCGRHQATERFTEIEDGLSATRQLCRDCYLEELGPVDPGRVRRLLEIERLLPGADFGRAARELADQAERHRQRLAPEVLAFVQRHGVTPPQQPTA